MGVEKLKDILRVVLLNLCVWSRAFNRPGTKQPKGGTNYVAITYVGEGVNILFLIKVLGKRKEQQAKKKRKKENTK
jgi:hypothetical protein